MKSIDRSVLSASRFTRYFRTSCVLVPVFLLFSNWWLRRDAPVQIDEPYWIGQAYYYNLAFKERDWRHSDWKLLPAREHPQIGKYMIGLALDAGGRHIATPDLLGLFLFQFQHKPGAWGSGQDYENRYAVVQRISEDAIRAYEETGTIPIDKADIRTARALMMLLGTLATFSLFTIARVGAGWRTGVVASLLFALHPTVADACSWALIDMVPLSFSILSILGIVLISQKAWNKSRYPKAVAAGLAIFTGTFLGLACGAKMNALIVAAAGGLLMLGYAIRAILYHKQEDRTDAVVMTGALAFGFCLFLLSNPVLLANPLTGMEALFLENQHTVRIQNSFIEGGLHSAFQRLAAIADMTCRWPWLFTVVVASAIHQTLDSVRKFSSWSVIICWWWVGLVFLLCWLPFPWDRYILPLIPPSLLLVAHSFDQLGCYLLRLVRHRAEDGRSNVPAA